ncbi:MAG: neutral/alkaline non-lysosomal ceramidase N-terminal domain-containing protein [Candidatus Zipacnadales bacterium]
MPRLSTQRIRAGVARANITPSVGVDLVGFAGRGPSIGLGDELYATALVLDDGHQRVAILHLDLLNVETTWAKTTCKLIGKQGRLSAENVLLCCTHTHYGPNVAQYQNDPHASPEAAYMAELKFKLSGIVQEARSKLRPVMAKVGRSTSDIGVNRREKLPDGRVILGQNPDGAIDREVIVIRIERITGEPLCCLLNFAAHPVSQTHRGRLISADFPGYARQVVEDLTGATCLYLQGACGNLNTTIMKEGLDTPRTLGKRLGAAAVQAYETAQPAELAPIGVRYKVAKLPAKTYASLQEAEVVVERLHREHEQAVKERNKGRLRWAEIRLERAQKALESLRSGKPLPPVEAPIWGMVLGEIGIATGPGEIFCEIGLAVKQAGVVPHTLYVSNTNGAIGYVPVAEAYLDGGYEVESASRVGPGAATIVTDTSIAMLKEARREAYRVSGK